MAEVCSIIEGQLDAEGLGIKDPGIAKVLMGRIVAPGNKDLIVVDRYHKMGNSVDGLAWVGDLDNLPSQGFLTLEILYLQLGVQSFNCESILAFEAAPISLLPASRAIKKGSKNAISSCLVS